MKAIHRSLVVTLSIVLSPLHLQAAESPGKDDSALTHGEWKLVSLHRQPPGTLVETSLEFNEDGRFGGFNGCNFYRGRFEIQDSMLRFTEEMATTRRACPQSLAKHVLVYSVALGKSMSFRIVDHRLELLGSGGARLAAFERVPTSPSETEQEDGSDEPAEEGTEGSSPDS